MSILLVLLPAPTSGQGASPTEYVPGEVLVKFKKGPTDIYVQSLLNQIKAQQVRDFPFINVQHLKSPDSMKLPEYLELLRSDPQVEYAEPNYIVRASAIPNDPDFNKLWGLHNTAQTRGTADADIDAPEAWDIWTGSSRTIIAVIDSGVNYNHEDLEDNIWINPDDPSNGIDDDGNGMIDDIRGWDFVNADNDPMDDNGHGTHVAGIIAAMGDNGKGVVGVNWTAKIMPLKFLNNEGSGTTADAISAIQYAINKGAKVLSNSWGSANFSQALRDAVMATHNAGTLFVAAAGNDAKDNDTSPEYPANYEVPNVVSVAATDHKDTLASFSNYSATGVHVAAPGQSIYSTYILLSSYKTLSGTSQATPYVSGLAALIWSSPNLNSLTNIELKYNIMATSDPLPSLTGRVLSQGRINANNALTCSDNTLALFNNSFGDNFSFETSLMVRIKVILTTYCGTAVPQATVNASFSNGDETLVLFDDGEHSDDGAGDGVYANSWRPQKPGATTLTITATKAAFTSTTLSQSGTVVQNYRYDDTVAFDWIDASSGIDTGIKEDNGSAVVDIGFIFYFYGNTYSQVRIDSNGYLSFDLQNDPESDFQNGTVPNLFPPNNIIAPFWDDLDTSRKGTIFYLISGTPPNRVFTVEWHQVPHVADIVDDKPVDTLGDATFGVSFYEANGEIVFRYQDVSFADPDFDQGLSATVGIENKTGLIGRPYSFNSRSLKGQLAIRFSLPETTPLAKAGPDQLVPTGSLVMLDGTGSFDAVGRALSYTWSLVTKPPGSEAAIADSKELTTSFTADLDGVYIASLVVDNGQEQSSPDTINIRALGSNTKIQIATNKSFYKAGDLLEVYLWLGNGVSEPSIEADAFIGFGIPDGRLFFFDPSTNLKEGDPSNPRTFTPIVQDISLPAVWVFPEPADMDADSDSNGKFDTYRLFSTRLPHLPPGEYFAFAALTQPGTTQAGSPVLIGQISLVFFSFSENSFL